MIDLLIDFVIIIYCCLVQSVYSSSKKPFAAFLDPEDGCSCCCYQFYKNP